MTLEYIWRSFSLVCHSHVHFSYPWHAFASHGLQAIAELLVTVRRSALHGLCDSKSVRPSVRPSFCPSVTLVDCVHMVWPTIMTFSPYCSPIILVSGDITVIPKFDGDHPVRGRWMRVWWVRIGDFRPISRRRYICKTVRDTTKVTITTNRKSYTRFRLVPKSTTLVEAEMTLDGRG